MMRSWPVTSEEVSIFVSALLVSQSPFFMGATFVSHDLNFLGIASAQGGVPGYVEGGRVAWAIPCLASSRSTVGFLCYLLCNLGPPGPP
jgi:hypothetical protein